MVAGTTVRWHRSFDDYRASDGWTYTFYAIGATDKFQIAATINPDTNSFDIVVPAALTTSLAGGRYQCGEVLNNSTLSPPEQAQPSKDRLELLIELSVASASPGAFITHVERTLAIIEAAIEGRMTADLETYQIAGRSVSKIPIKELLGFRGLYRSKLYQLQNPGRLGAPVLIAFTNEPEQPIYPPTWVDITGLDA